MAKEGKLEKMNPKQREYVVTQIEKNRDESKTLSNGVTRDGFFLGIASLAVIINVSGLGSAIVNQDVVSSVLQGSLLLLNGGLAIHWVKNMVEKLSKKGNIDFITEKLEYDLQIDNLEKRGKTI